RLHLLLRDVEPDVEVELQRDHRRAPRAGGRHLAQPGHLSELALERRGDRRGHHFRARARVEGHHEDRRVVDLRQRRKRQLAEGEQPGEHDRHHRERGRDRAQDEKARRIHRRAPTWTLAPSRRRSMPSTTTRSPTETPDSTATRSPSLGPSFTGRTLTVLSSFTT